MLNFNAKTAKLLETAYQGADFSRRRRASFDALGPKPGDIIADIGCGNGMLTLELARTVGDHGRVIGIDPSEDMRSAAVARCADWDNVAFHDGTATQIPLDSASVDKAVSLQVFEYLDDLPGAVAEAHRLLKPGGRLVIGDMHWDTITWFSDHADRMEKMIDAWDGHLVERCIPAVLPPLLRAGGFAVDAVLPVPFSATVLNPDGLANMMIHLMEPYVVNKGLVSAEDARAWAEEQQALSDAGRFFFSITHFVISARKL
ncbi:methyltransferase domain-containing protein [Roseibium sediminicola]|uniref:Methyltransferase domain-containing protein n=1 Tax=Roseibium sediminicola TaxID=2933272 RepID=A0ABT0GVC7_9HYPH|nr:methyltransferase domain-containing protein [Roseibium sp. CAU 1639]MCK7613400.1 methyltransferase domain-containing protein [Roseibium sp. CAU 1639]